VIAYTFQWDVIRPAIGELWHGLRITLELSLLSLVLSLALGLVVALARMSPFWPLRAVADVYIAVFRALSLYIYVLWIYFGIASAVGINLSPLQAGVIALTILNSA
jgi:His/Glu/Gln/Arg/opine family amino acid ABC transporter permease subunit